MAFDNQERAIGTRLIMHLATKRLPLSARYGIIGGGICLFQRMMNFRFRDDTPTTDQKTITFELEQDIADWNDAEWGIHSNGWTWVIGDYHTTLLADPQYEEFFDVLVYDVDDEDIPRTELETRIKPGGSLFIVPDHYENP